GDVAAALRPGGLAPSCGTAGDAGGSVLGRGRLGELYFVQGRSANEEQTPGLVAGDRHRRDRAPGTGPIHPGRPPHDGAVPVARLPGGAAHPWPARPGCRRGEGRRTESGLRPSGDLLLPRLCGFPTPLSVACHGVTTP